MRCTILSADDSDRWLAHLGRLPHADIYHSPQYHHAYEGSKRGRAWAYVAEDGGHILFHPVMVRPIGSVGRRLMPDAWHDAETVYGYSGPVATSDDPHFLAEAWRGYDVWCREQGIVCEFVRFNPMLGNQAFAAPDTVTWCDRQTVVMRLNRGEDELWANYAGVHRNAVRKAKKHGLACEPRPIEHGLSEFLEIYRQSMRELDADDFYFFSEEHFTRLVGGLGNQVRLFLVFYRRRPVAAALFLLFGDTIHYHLAGSVREYRELGPNNLLLHEVASWGCARGYRQLHLGGGRTPAPDDSLFRFKARFSPDRCELYLGKRVLDACAYQSLLGEWRQQFGGGDEPKYFQLYRLNPPGIERARL